MKKLIYCCLAILMCTFCAPVFSACAGEAETELSSVRFTQSVFEADPNKPFELTYKAYPSSAINYDDQLTFYFTMQGNEIPTQTYSWSKETGIFTILDSNCPEITAKVNYGAGEHQNDTCIIRLKKYPTDFYFAKNEDSINAGGTYNLQLKGIVGGVEQTLDRNGYDIELSSDAPHIVSVSQEGLVAVSTGKSGSANISARIKKIGGTYLGQDDGYANGITTTIKLNVIENIKSAVVAINTENKFISTSTNFTKTDLNSYTTTANQIKLKFLFYGDNNICINNQNLKIDVISDSSIAEVAKLQNGAYNIVNGEYTINLKTDGTACIQITTNATTDTGEPVRFIFYITKTTQTSE